MNAAPSGSDATLTVLEDGQRVFSQADFGFSDADGGQFASVTITTLPALGTLLLRTTAVTAGQTISAQDIADGLLVWRPAANANGAAYATLSFAVRDDGGTANGGVDTDQTPNNLRFDVTPVNDRPTGVLSPVPVPLGGEILVNGATDWDQTNPRIARLAGGNFVITWTDGSMGAGGATGDPSLSAVKAQVFTSAGTKVGTEILVNTATQSNQNNQQIAALSDGGFLIVWQDNSAGVGGATGDTSSTAIKAQLYTSDGARVGTEMRINATTNLAQNAPQVTALANGGAAIAWEDNSGVGDTSFTGLRARVVSATGVLGDETRVNTATASNQTLPQLATLSDGSFVVVWQDNSVGAGGAGGDPSTWAVKGQRFTAAGVQSGAEFRVNTAFDGTQTAPQVTALANGGFIVTWDDNSRGVGGAQGDTLSLAVKGQLYDNAGARVGTEILVNTAVASGQNTSRIAALPNGGFVVTWQDWSLGVGGTSGDADVYAVKAQVFTATGGKTGAEILVNTATAGAQEASRVTALTDGGFVVTWQDNSRGVGGATGDTSGHAIKAQAFFADGTPNGVELRVNTATDNGQLAPQVTALPDGRFAITWTDSSEGVGGATGDVDPPAIKAQVFEVPSRYQGVEQLAVNLKGSLSVADVDGGSLTATLSANHGIFNVTAGTSGAIVGANGTASVTISGTIAQINALLRTNATSTVSYLANTDAPPATATLTLAVNDGQETASVTRTVAITGINDAPAGSDRTVAIPQDGRHVFTIGDFAFTDAEGNALSTVRLTTLPTVGTMLLGGVAVTAGQSISAADIAAGRLTYAPVAGASGAAYASFTFQVRDNGGTANGGVDLDATANLITLNVNAFVPPAEIPPPAPLPSSTLGTAGDDTLTGTLGADTLSGGAGNDVYVVGPGDVVVEGAGGGNDVLFTTISFALSADAEVETLSTHVHAGTEAINLTGNAFSQSIIGNNGNNIINGLGGADTMIGLGGNDQYLVRGAGDQVIEGNGGGIDTVFTTVGYSLGVNEVEVLSTVTNGDTTNIDLTGNFATQTIVGNYGTNVLNGGSGGLDTLIGLRGNDVYAVGDSRTVIVENAGEGSDTVVVAVDYTLAAGVSVEVLAAQDRSGTTALALRGNEVAQTVVGNNGANILDGGLGSDQLAGGGGADSFRFTTALGANNVDSIADFEIGVDRIGLSSAIFNVGGGVTASNFVNGTAALDGDDRILFDRATGQLFYDADGSGAGASVLFALVSPGLVLTSSSFEIVVPAMA